MSKLNKFKIECSFGEIVDKYTILKIKLKKAKDKNKINNIKKEYDILSEYINNDDQLFDKLLNINKKLWVLEDTIRLKSYRKEFDKTYINCAESIHITNDERARIKGLINDKYNSNIREEKIYNKIDNNINDNSNNNDMNLIDKAKKLFESNNVSESYKIFNKLYNKYSKFDKINDFIVDLIVGINICKNMLGLSISISNFEKLDYILKNLSEINNNMLVKCFINNYCFTMLKNKKYESVKDYMKYLQSMNGPFNININTISYLKEKDENKTVLLYYGGGLGDNIMHSRFLIEYCNINSKNNFIYFVKDKLYWIFKQVFSEVSNLELFTSKSINSYLSNNHFDHHSSIIELFCIMNKKYEDISNNKYLKDINGSNFDLSNIIDSNKKNIIINWCGNKENANEENNRRINLDILSNVFESNKNINWISIQKECNNNEKKILEKYDVKDLSEIIDNDNEKAFYDSVTIMKNVDLVISTDTSIIHLAGSMGIKSVCLLTIGNEWRWTSDVNTNWYQDIKLLRQNKFNDWSNVINELNNYIKNM